MRTPERSGKKENNPREACSKLSKTSITCMAEKLILSSQGRVRTIAKALTSCTSKVTFTIAMAILKSKICQPKSSVRNSLDSKRSSKHTYPRIKAKVRNLLAKQLLRSRSSLARSLEKASMIQEITLMMLPGSECET